MSIFNHPDFFTLHQLDLENKLILPTTKLYAQASFQLNSLYQDIRSVLIDAHSTIAAAAKNFYDQPVETLSTWYAQIETAAAPVYQDWQLTASTGVKKTNQYLHDFWNNPEQVALATLEPVTRYAATIADQSERYWQLVMDNPEQFMATAFAPITNYLAALSEETEAALIGSYYFLADLFRLLLEQPSATLKALYHNTLSGLLDMYFDVISSLLVIL